MVSQDNYDMRFVAFIDILGFKDIIKHTLEGPDEYVRIKKVLNYIADIQQYNYYGALAESGILKDVSVFSDSIVISYSLKTPIGGALFHVLIDIVHLYIELLNNGIFVRGGISYGEMYHNQKICFGPAMISAYMLEEEKAIYPRIVIERKAIETGIRNPGSANTVNMERQYISGLISKDKKDKVYYLDFLSQVDEFDDIDGYLFYLERVKKYVENELEKSYPYDIHLKYVWFAHYYNQTIQKISPSDPNDMKIKIDV